MLRKKNSAEKQMDVPPTSSITTILAVLLFTSSFFSVVQSSRNLTIVNNCRRTIWPVIIPSANSEGPNGFILKSNESKTLTVPEYWAGRVWGRTHCNTNSTTGNFSCLTGDCGSGRLQYCDNKGTPPVSFAEITITKTDYYDVTLIEGFNLPMLVVPEGRAKGNCKATGCITDLNKQCPWELKKARGNGNETIACMSACQAFGDHRPCCSGYGNMTLEECGRPTLYNSYFKNACPQAYSFAYDDQASLFTCTSAEHYSIIFCPSPPKTSLLSGATYAPAPAPGDGALVRKTTKKSRSWIRFYIAPAASLLLLLAFLCAFCYRRRNVRVITRRMSRAQSWKKKDKGEKDSLFFSYPAIESATNYFSDENILGRGGYGPVYKGKLLNGQEIAVKRLQKMSGHGIEQFKNEVSVISKLQHRNLVRLLGYCSDNNERILIYEYLPNKSLDSIIFDAEKRSTLGWKSRLEIIEGIAQGILYLHKYSRLKIIHRDLKTSNVLLDNDLNPKISDFGTAKIFGDDELSANTNRIVGTYGYMAPEYAMDGIFSMKSDVFSFGVMMLEIISGKKNTGFYNSDRHINLIGYVWDLWNEDRVLETVDPYLVEEVPIHEVIHYVQIGLLCAQENAGDRPTMSAVVSMLQNELMSLSTPKQPSFTTSLSITSSNLYDILEHPSLNVVTISDVQGR